MFNLYDLLLCALPGTFYKAINNDCFLPDTLE
jgi:hypothetical protein